MGSERVDERDIRRIPTSRDNNSAYPWDIVARIERPPRPVEVQYPSGAGRLAKGGRAAIVR